MDFVLDIATVGLVTIAIVNRIKAEVTLKSIYYTIIAIVVGAGLYAVSVYAPDIVIGMIFAGLIGSGIYDVYKKQ
jgi:hypothetical protein